MIRHVSHCQISRHDGRVEKLDLKLVSNVTSLFSCAEVNSNRLDVGAIAMNLILLSIRFRNSLLEMWAFKS